MLGATLKEELPQLMKNIIVIAIVVAIGWYGNYLYKQHGYNTDFVRNSSIDLANEKKVKCITKTGSVIYGTVPQGTICEKLELIEGSLTAVSSETHTESGYSSSKKIAGIQVSNVMVESIAAK
jgi:hypothetical protein